MNWIPSLPGWWPWALLGALPILVTLLYFLKLRREPVEVPSTYLWSRTIEDLHVNSLMQRLRQNLLLFLQLLAILLAAFALMRPGVRSESSPQDRFVYLLDTSASMAASDVESFPSRFAQAKDQIRTRIEALQDNQSAMLVTFSDRAEVLQAFTSDRNRLRQALDAAELTNRTTDILGALRAADGLANPRRTSEAGAPDVQVADALPAELHLYSDGGFQPVTEFNLGNLIPVYHAMGRSDAANLAITAFSAERNIEQPTQVQAFATVSNTGQQPVSATLALSVDGEFFEGYSIDLEPGDQEGFSFELESEESVALEVELQQASRNRPLQDALAVDNVAYAGLSPLRSVSVLVVTPGNQPLKLGLQTAKAQRICDTQIEDTSYLQTDEFKARAAAGSDDLIIFDRCRPEAMPLTNTFSIGELPHDGWKWGGPPAPVVLVDLDRTHPLMRYVELFSLLIFEGRPIEGPAGTIELVGGDRGSVLCLADRDGYQDLVLGFEMVSEGETGAAQANTNWFTERSWPVFLLNTLRYLAGAAEASGAPSYQPGQTVRIRLENQLDQVTIQETASNQSWKVPLAMNDVVEFVETDDVGLYQVMGKDRTVDTFAVNLFAPSESNVTTAPSIELGYESVSADTAGVEERSEYWRLLLLAMLGLLGAEWWYYSRRVA
ncbi:MAG: VWA domain-containing protein [Planctomycetota bacterium]